MLWLFKYHIFPMRMEIIHGGLNIYGFYHGMALYADILPLAVTRGKIFGIKGQPVVKSLYIQAPMNYFLTHFNCNGSYNRLNHVEIVVHCHVIDMIYQLILLNIIVNHIKTKCYMQQLDILFLTMHQHLTISCIVCYFWCYAWLKCGFLHIASRNPILFCYMCIKFYYLHRCLAVYLMICPCSLWSFHVTIYIIKQRPWYKNIISDTYDHNINISYYPAYDFNVNDDWPVTHRAYFN